jgi:hypothetical protein
LGSKYCGFTDNFSELILFVGRTKPRSIKKYYLEFEVGPGEGVKNLPYIIREHPFEIPLKFSAFLSTTKPTTTITSGARMEDANGSDQTEEPDEAEDVKTIIQSFHITSNIQFR